MEMGYEMTLSECRRTVPLNSERPRLLYPAYSERPHDLRQGGVALYEVKPILGLSEYMSRHCRLRLVEACARGLERELSERCDTGVSHLDPRVGAASVLAGILGVSRRTVQRWLSGGVQSCNVNAEKLIQASLEHAPEETKRLLVEDLQQHGAELKHLVKDVEFVVPDHAIEDEEVD